MADRGVTVASDWLKPLAALVALALVVAGAVLGYRSYTVRYEVTPSDDGRAVAQVVAAALYRSADLRVSRLTGTVQGVSVDTRGFGMLRSQRIVKAPFEVGYFVDLSTLRPAAFRYDPARRILRVEAPAVRVARPDIDESRTSLDDVSGVFVTRKAMSALQKRATESAMRAADREARKPENIAAAKANARRALSDLFAGTLRAARIDARVEIAFPDDPRPDAAQWDRSRSLQDVLGNIS